MPLVVTLPVVASPISTVLLVQPHHLRELCRAVERLKSASALSQARVLSLSRRFPRRLGSTQEPAPISGSFWSPARTRRAAKGWKTRRISS